jgi:hypothetical protein
LEGRIIIEAADIPYGLPSGTTTPKKYFVYVLFAIESVDLAIGGLGAILW